MANLFAKTSNHSGLHGMAPSRRGNASAPVQVFWHPPFGCAAPSMAPLASTPGSIGTGSPGPPRRARRQAALVLRTGAGGSSLVMLTIAAILAAATPVAQAHPWHHHRAGDHETTGKESAPTEGHENVSFRLTTAKKPAVAPTVDIAEAFAPFEKRGDLKTRRDDRWFFIESNGIPDHPLMIGIRAWQQQVPLPQNYVGDNAWQIPLHPVPAANPATTKGRFLRGAVAYALDGYPIYGTTEPDGSPVKDLDWMGGHEDADGHYHDHATKSYPYLNGGFPGPGGPEGRPPRRPPPGDDRPPPPPREGRPPRADSSPTPEAAASTVGKPHLHRERNRARGGENRRAGSDGQNLHDSAGIGHRRHGDVDSSH